MLPLNNSILLKSVRERGMMNHVDLGAKKKKIKFNKLHGVISTKNLNCSRKLSLYLIIKLFDDRKNLRTILQEVQPSHVRKVINENKKIPKTRIRCSPRKPQTLECTKSNN